MTLKMQEGLQAASAVTMHHNHQGIDVEHLLLALLEQTDGSASPILEQAGKSTAAVKTAVEQALKKLPQVQALGGGTRPSSFGPSNGEGLIPG